MTPQEQELISQLFARMKQAPAQPKDPEAEALIRRGVAEQPDAPYLLVQTVIIQDMALANAQNRLTEVERELATAKALAPAERPANFLGGALARAGLASGPWGRRQDTVPAPQPSPATTWTHSAGPAPSPWGSPGMMGPGVMGPAMMPGASSGFLRAAAATALGVAGGQLLFQGVESLFGAHAGGMLAGAPMQPALSETVINNYYDDQHAPTANADYRPDDAGANALDATQPDADRSDGGITSADYDPGQNDGGQDASTDSASDTDFGSDPGFGGDDITGA